MTAAAFPVFGSRSVAMSFIHLYTEEPSSQNGYSRNIHQELIIYISIFLILFKVSRGWNKCTIPQLL